MEEQKVTITKINIPFFNLMWLLVEIGLASIPAAFLVGIAYFTLLGYIGGLVK